MAYISGSTQTSGSSVFVDTFVGGVDYTPGTSSQVTLSETPATVNSIWVFFNGIVQHHTEFSLTGNVLVFTEAIPLNVGTIEVQNNTQLAVGVPGANTVQYSSMTPDAITTLQRKNAIINGDFDIWQRGTTQSGTGFGSADRWGSYFQGTSVTNTISQQSFALGQTSVPNNPKYFARNTIVSGSDTTTAIQFYQSIEGVKTFAGETITLSFWAKTSASLDITCEILQGFGTGGSPSADVYVTPQKVSCTTLWTKYELTYTIPSISGKTLGTNNNDRLAIVLWFSAGSTQNARSDTLGLQSGTFDIAQVQVEKGDTATDFEYTPIADELARCQRYFQEIPYGYQGTGLLRATSTTVLTGESKPALSPMRATPTGSLSATITDLNTRELSTNTTVADCTLTVGTDSDSSYHLTVTKTGFTTGAYYGGTLWASPVSVYLDAEL